MLTANNIVVTYGYKAVLIRYDSKNLKVQSGTSSLKLNKLKESKNYC